MPTRRHALAAGLASLSGLTPAARLRTDDPLAPLDRFLVEFLTRHDIPGAALAVARHGRLVYARGFGVADRDAGTPVAPDSRFRVASVSKPFTAAAVLKLVERGKLRLDDPAHTHLPKLAPPAGATPDARWPRVTVRHLLNHTAGWDRGKSGDPIARPREVADALGTRPPVPPADVARYALGRPLDSDPGTKYAYSNVGYLLLGRVIEYVGGKPYEAFVRDEVLAPLGVAGPRLGKATPAGRLPGEVRYYDRRRQERDSLYPPGGRVPTPDGGMNFEGFEAHGGWVATAPELVRFAALFDDPAHGGLKPTTAVTARPPGEAGRGAAYYGGGWRVRPAGGGFSLWHAGYIPGTEALLVRRHDGFAWAVLFNTQDGPTGGPPLTGRIDGPMHKAVDAVKQWPAALRLPPHPPRAASG